MAETIKIAGELESTATGNVVASASAIKDKVKNKYQGEINAETDATLANHASAINGLNTQNYVTVTATDQTSAVTDVLPPSGSVDTVYRVGNWDGTQYDETCYSEYSWNGSAYVHIDTKTQIGEVFDISAYHATGGTLAKYADLDAALDSNNGGGVPESLQKGGMSVKFVQSSDNKYVQYRLTAQSFTTDTTQWAICDNSVLVECPEYVAVYTDADGKIILAVENDGNIHFGAGVPQQVVDYINEKIAELSLDEYEDIVAFLNGLESGEKTLSQLLAEKADAETVIAALATKVDKVEGKSLIDEEYASTKSTIDNPEFLDVTLDAEDKVLEGTQQDGTKVIGGDIKILGNMEVSGVSYKVIDNPEYLAAWVDAKDKVVFGLKTNGKTYVGDADFLNDIKNNQEAISEINAIIASISSTIEPLDIDALTSITATENPEFMEVELDAENKILGGRKADGTKFENNNVELNGNATVGGSLEVDGVIIKNSEDPEERSEITTDAEDKVISYRKKDGTLVEAAGIETPKLHTDSFKLPRDTKGEVEEIAKEVSDKSSVKIKRYNLPKFGSVNIVNETFYLTADNRYSDLDGVYLIRDYEDSDANASAHITLDYFYIKSTLTNNGDGTYSKNANSVKLDFYPAGKVAKVSDKFYVLASLGEGGTVLPTSIELTQLTDTPHVNAWPVNKKDEHYCTVTVDFGHYLTGTFKMGVKFQGSSTLNYRKKNFRFTFYKSAAKPYYPYDDDKFGKKEKVKIGEFVRLSGFNLKANWTDTSRVKEAVMYRLLEAVWDIPGSVDSYPWAKEHTAYTGATGLIKCFPIECNVAGEFYGYDFFGLKKDGKNYLLDKDEDGMFECGIRGNWRDTTNWTDAHPIDWEDELNDEEDWVIEHQTQSNFEALREFFAFINSRLYKAEDESTYLVSQVTQVGSKFYVTSTLTPGEGSVTATRTEDPAYIGSDNNLYILSELTDISGTLYVTSTLVDGQPTADSVTAVLSSGGHNIYLGTDGERYLSTDLVTINGVKYVPSKIVWDTTNATEVELIPFDKEHMPDRMSIEHWLKYIVCMQVFLMRDNTCRNMVLYTGNDKKKYYPFFYDLDLSWNFGSSSYNLDIMVPADPTGQGGVSYAGDMSLWENFKNEWWDEIVNCYHILRGKVLNIPYMRKALEDIVENVPDEVLEKERIKWGTTVNPFDGKIDIMELRLKWLDEEYYK